MIDVRQSVVDAQHQRCLELAQTLAWAAKTQTPFTEALRSLQTSAAGFATRLLLGNMFAGPVFLSLFAPFGSSILVSFMISPSAAHAGALNRLCDRLEEGVSLGPAMRRSMRRILPAWYIDAVAAADKQGMLEEILPRLADDLRHSRVPQLWRLALLRGYVLIPLLALPLMMMFTFIWPKFLRMFSDIILAAGRQVEFSLAGPFMRALAVGSYALTGILALVLLLAAARYVGRLAGRLLNWDTVGCAACRRLTAALLFPPFRRLCRQAELLRYIEVAVRLQQPFPQAIGWALQSNSDPWTTKQLRRFQEALTRGTHWVRAWVDSVEDCGNINWLILNGAVRNSPASGFALAARQVYHTAVRRRRRIHRWLFYGALAAEAGVVAGLTLTVLGCLAHLVEAMMTL